MSDALELHGLAARLANMERQNRRFKLILCAWGAVLCIGFVLGARNLETLDVIQAKSFVLV